jgi:hypothetical protein
MNGVNDVLFSSKRGNKSVCTLRNFQNSGRELLPPEIFQCLSGEKILGAESLVFQFTTQKLKIKLYRTITLPMVLYGCKTWFLTWREERRLNVFDSRMLRRIFKPKRDEVTREWRRIHNKELYALYFSVHIIWVILSRRMKSA